MKLAVQRKVLGDTVDGIEEVVTATSPSLCPLHHVKSGAANETSKSTAVDIVSGSTPAIHIHLNGLAATPTSNTAVYSSSIKHRVPSGMSDSESSDSDSDSPDRLTIAVILDKLDWKYPVIDYPQYARPLAARKICYARHAADFDRQYYVKQIGMAEGAIGPFIELVRKMTQKQKRNVRKRKAKWLSGQEKKKQRGQNSPGNQHSISSDITSYYYSGSSGGVGSASGSGGKHSGCSSSGASSSEFKN